MQTEVKVVAYSTPGGREGSSLMILNWCFFVFNTWRGITMWESLRSGVDWSTRV